MAALAGKVIAVAVVGGLYVPQLPPLIVSVGVPQRRRVTECGISTTATRPAYLRDGRTLHRPDGLCCWLPYDNPTTPISREVRVVVGVGLADAELGRASRENHRDKAPPAENPAVAVNVVQALFTVPVV